MAETWAKEPSLRGGTTWVSQGYRQKDPEISGLEMAMTRFSTAVKELEKAKDNFYNRILEIRHDTGGVLSRLEEAGLCPDGVRRGRESGST